MTTKNGLPGYIDWMTENYCIHCDKICIKGTYKCPDCHLRVRIVPHNHYHKTKAQLLDIKRKLIKDAQVKAAQILKNNGWVLPPARVSAK